MWQKSMMIAAVGLLAAGVAGLALGWPGVGPMLAAGCGLLLTGLAFERADVARFGVEFESAGEIPPLGLARGTVRALLAMGLLAAAGGVVYVLLREGSPEVSREILTFATAGVSSVVAFYFGARTAGKAEKS